jgi:hypothetical protein
MANKCVSLETAKRLKEAGWPQDTTDNHWFEYCGKEKIEVKPGLSTNRITGGNFKNYDAPDVSDLLAALPKGTWLNIFNHSLEWQVQEKNQEEVFRSEFLVEAVASLWLFKNHVYSKNNKFINKKRRCKICYENYKISRRKK